MENLMPLQNRVTPAGDIISHSSREGRFMGNRGILHDSEGRLGRARWKHRAWVICALSFNGRRRSLMKPGSYTELFFLDEAVALAAGHRPCGECRHAAHRHFADCWHKAHGGDRSKSAALDAALHAARVDSRTRMHLRHEADLDSLPDGAFVEHPDLRGAWLVLGDHLRRYTPAGYTDHVPRMPGGTVSVLTPRPTLLTIAAGYAPEVHPTACT